MLNFCSINAGCMRPYAKCVRSARNRFADKWQRLLDLHWLSERSLFKSHDWADSLVDEGVAVKRATFCTHLWAGAEGL